MVVARSLRILLTVIAALTIAACGSGGESDSRSSSAPDGLPNVTVDEVGGKKVNLATLTPGKKPLLVWAWSPI